MEKFLIYVACALVGYFFGCFSLSSLIAKRKGFDIRSRGSKNAGASNAAVTMGWKIGVLVGFCDIMKCFIPVLAAKLIFPDLYLVPYIAGICCVLGHMHPFYMNFRGGKGFASYLGMILAIDWRIFLIIGVILLAAALISNYIVLGTLSTMVSFPVLSYVFYRNYIAAIMVAMLSLLILYRHRKNFVSIAKGEERKIFSVLKKKEGEYEDK